MQITLESTRKVIYSLDFFNLPLVIAWLLDIQACVTEWAGTCAGNPQLSIAWNNKQS